MMERTSTVWTSNPSSSSVEGSWSRYRSFSLTEVPQHLLFGAKNIKNSLLCQTEESPETACRNSQVIVTGVPVKSYRLPVSWISPNTVIINVASFKNVDQEE